MVTENILGIRKVSQYKFLPSGAYVTCLGEDHNVVNEGFGFKTYWDFLKEIKDKAEEPIMFIGEFVKGLQDVVGQGVVKYTDARFFFDSKYPALKTIQNYVDKYAYTDKNWNDPSHPEYMSVFIDAKNTMLQNKLIDELMNIKPVQDIRNKLLLSNPDAVSAMNAFAKYCKSKQKYTTIDELHMNLTYLNDIYTLWVMYDLLQDGIKNIVIVLGLAHMDAFNDYFHNIASNQFELANFNLGGKIKIEVL